MLIENINAFNAWLTSCLGKLSDADPRALSKYVIALVRKDKPEEELKNFCIDQLEVFLMDQTNGFVEELFEALRTKAYLPNPQPSDPSLKQVPVNIIESAFDEEPLNTVNDIDSAGTDLHESRSRSWSGTQPISKSGVVEDRRSFEAERYQPSHKLEKDLNYDRRHYSSFRPKCSRSKDYSNRHYRSRSPLRKSGSNGRIHCTGSRSSSASSKEDICELNHSELRKLHNRSSPLDLSDQGDTDCRVEAGSLNSAFVSVMHSSKAKHRATARCTDYDEKGYCMQGDQCHYDHGADPVIVEDVSTLNFGTTSSASSSALPASSAASVNITSSESLPPLPSSPPPLPPPPPPLPMTGKPFPPEPYNPEAPGIYCAKSDSLAPWASHSLSSSLPYVSFNPNNPPPGFYSKSQRTRELIGVPLALNVNNNIASATEDTGGALVDVPGERRGAFDYNRLGQKQLPNKNWIHTTSKHLTDRKRSILEIRKIPRHLNSILLLGQHFSKFGNIKTIQTFFNNDPEAAIVEFATCAAATAAYRSSEPVLNNRFIKVFWNKEGNILPPPELESIDKMSEGTPTAGSVMNEKMANKFPEHNKLTRTAFKFNPAALRKNNITVPSMLKAKGEPQKEALNKKLSLYKKKTQMISELVQNQKILLNKLSLTKDEKVKEGVKKMLDEVEMQTAVLQEQLKRDMEQIKTSTLKTPFRMTKKTDTEKELLDVEMDLYNKEHHGDDVKDLMGRISILKEKAFNLVRGKNERESLQRSLSHGYWSRMPRSRRRGSFFPSEALGRSVDHRPKKILVTSNPALEEEAIRSKFMQFGEIQSFEMSPSGTFITYKSRKEAELAMQLGTKNSQSTINVFWAHDNSPHQTASDPQNIQASGSSTADNMELLEEEEEDEDSESRSWRR